MLITDIQQQLKEAQLARDEIKVSTLRLVLSEMKNSQIQKGQNLTEGEIISVIQREVKKRKEAAAGFRQGGREEAAQKEELEMKVLESFLPQQLTNEELTKLVEDSLTELKAKGLINETGAKGMQDMGKVMGSVMSKVAGRADGNTVSSIVKSILY